MTIIGGGLKLNLHNKKDFIMLCLMRRKGESISIFPNDIPKEMTVEELFVGGAIEIVVTETNDAQCKLLIKAPKELNIVRDDMRASL